MSFAVVENGSSVRVMSRNERLINLKEVLAEIEAMPTVKAEGHDFIEKNFLKTRLEFWPSAQPEYERVSAEDVAVSIAPTKLASAVWLYGTLTELEKAGYVICRRMT